MQTAPSERWLDLDGLRIHYLVAGDIGSHVILLHGGGFDSASLTYRFSLGPLSRRHVVIAPDLPGYGQSDKPKIDYSMEYYLTFLGRFMDTLGLERASLVGLSLGGGVALGFTLRHPRRVERLVLVDSYGLGSEAPWPLLTYLYVRVPGLAQMFSRLSMRSRLLIKWSLKANAFGDPAAATDDLVDELVRSVPSDAGRAFISFQKSEVSRGGLRSSFVDRLSEIEVPTLLVHGEVDKLVPVAWARRAHQRIKGSRLEILPGAGHWSIREQPARFNELLDSFLDEQVDQ